MSDWLGDTLGNVLTVSISCCSVRQRLPPGQGVAITWRSLRQLVLYSGVALSWA